MAKIRKVSRKASRARKKFYKTAKGKASLRKRAATLRKRSDSFWKQVARKRGKTSARGGIKRLLVASNDFEPNLDEIASSFEEAYAASIVDTLLESGSIVEADREVDVSDILAEIPGDLKKRLVDWNVVETKGSDDSKESEYFLVMHFHSLDKLDPVTYKGYADKIEGEVISVQGEKDEFGLVSDTTSILVELDKESSEDEEVSEEGS